LAKTNDQKTIQDIEKKVRQNKSDLIIGIGSNTTADPINNVRVLNVSKNKITGWHGDPACVIDRYISRYGD